MVELNIDIKEISKTDYINKYYAFIDADEHLYVIGEEYRHEVPIIDISEPFHASYFAQDADTIEEFEEENHIEIVKMYGNYEDFKLTFSEK